METIKRKLPIGTTQEEPEFRGSISPSSKLMEAARSAEALPVGSPIPRSVQPPTQLEIAQERRGRVKDAITRPIRRLGNAIGDTAVNEGAVGLVKGVGRNFARGARIIGTSAERAGTGILFGKEGLDKNLEAARKLAADKAAKAEAARKLAADKAGSSSTGISNVTGINADDPNTPIAGVADPRMVAISRPNAEGQTPSVSGIRIARPDGTMAQYSPEQVAGMALSPNTEGPIFRGMGVGVVGDAGAGALQRGNEARARWAANPEKYGLRSFSAQRPSKEERVAREVGGVQRDIARLGSDDRRDVARIGAEATRNTADREDARLDKTLENKVAVQREANKAPSGKIDSRQSTGLLKRAELATKRYNDMLKTPVTSAEGEEAVMVYRRSLRKASGEADKLWSDYDKLTGGSDAEVATAAPTATVAKIRITRNGQTGTIDPKDFDPATDKRI